MNLFEKLIEVRKVCTYIQKGNKGYQFQYVSSSDTLGQFRAKMDELKLLLVPEVVEAKIREKTTKKGDLEILTGLNMRFVWINAEKPEERLEVPFYAQGTDNAERGVGKALTYAEKYFLLKFFNVATDKDDPDSFQQKHDNRHHNGRPPGNSGNITDPNSRDDIEELNQVIAEKNISDDVIGKLLGYFQAKSIDDLAPNQVQIAMTRFASYGQAAA
ncbi:MAG: ERF family protein [Verrucomicrobiota bacterium]